MSLRMSRLFALQVFAEAENKVYSVDGAGNITTLTLSEYETLPIGDPRMKRVRLCRRDAEATSLRVRGIDLTIEPMRN